LPAGAVKVLARKAQDAGGDAPLGDNLADLVNLMKQPPPAPISTDFHPFQSGSHTHLARVQKEKELYDEAVGAEHPTKANGVTAEAAEIRKMKAHEQRDISKKPGADAMQRLKTINSKLQATHDGLKQHLALEKKYKAQAAAAQQRMEDLEKDNSGMFGLIGALESAGAAGGELGNIISSGMAAARKGQVPDVSKQFDSAWKANLPGKEQGAAPRQRAR